MGELISYKGVYVQELLRIPDFREKIASYEDSLNREARKWRKGEPNSLEDAINEWNNFIRTYIDENYKSIKSH